jgi:hypothetical protein
MLNWQGWAATNFQGWGSVGTAAPAAPAATPVGHGKPSRRRHYVEIDGQYFEVRDHAQAVQILTKLHEAAKETAAEAAKAAVVKAKASPKAVAPEVVVPRMAVVKPDYTKEFVQQLQAQVDATNAQIAETYKAALAAAVAWQRNLDDEDEIIMLFAAGIL